MEKIYLQEVAKKNKLAIDLTKDQLIRDLIEAIQKMDEDEIIKEEERANCITLTINCKFE